MDDNMPIDGAIIRATFEKAWDAHQESCVLLATREAAMEEAIERRLQLQAELHSSEVCRAAIDALLEDHMLA